MSGDWDYGRPSSSRPRPQSESNLDENYITISGSWRRGPKRRRIHRGRNASFTIRNDDDQEEMSPLFEPIFLDWENEDDEGEVESHDRYDNGADEDERNEEHGEVESDNPCENAAEDYEEEEEPEEEENNEPQQEEDEGSKNTVVTLTDPDVFDCPICCEPLTIPVYQCDQNGHIACSSCCGKINNTCPSCDGHIESNRCRAIERALESMTTPCQNINYGCKEIVPYSERLEHQKSCGYSPCYCPEPGCDFASTLKELYQHYEVTHPHSATRFKYYNDVSVIVGPVEHYLVLQENDDGTLFVLDVADIEGIGTAVWLTCVQPEVFERGFCYDVVASNGEGKSVSLQSCAKIISTVVDIRSTDQLSATYFLLIPYNFNTSEGLLKLDLRIRPKISSQK